MRPAPLLLLAALLAAGCAAPAADETPAPAPPAPGEPAVIHGNVTGEDGVRIAYTAFRPAGADAARPVPVVVHAPGYGGERWNAPGADRYFGGPDAHLAAGLGVVSFDHRGFPGSEGEADWLDPAKEGRDTLAILDEIARWDWAARDAPGDPRVALMGLSYGGTYSWIAAIEETRAKGATRIDAILSVMPWHDLAEGVAPAGVARSLWMDGICLLNADAVRTTPAAQRACADLLALGTLSEESRAWALGRSPRAYFEEGLRLDVPVLLRAGVEDALFPLAHPWGHWERGLTPEAKARSTLSIGREGHRDIGATPPEGPTGCRFVCDSEGQAEAWTAWLRAQLLGGEASLAPGVHVAPEAGEALPLAGLPRGGVRAAAEGPVVVPALPAPVPRMVEIARGPMLLAGFPTLDLNATAGAAGARVFVALAAGATPEEARVLSNQWRPVALEPGASSRSGLELEGVVDRVREGERVFLAVAPSTAGFAHAARGGGAVVLADAAVALPVVDAGA